MENIFRLVSESLARHELRTRESEGAPSLSSVNSARQGGEVDFSLSSEVPVRVEAEPKSKPDSDVYEAVPPSISSAWGAGFLEVQDRETGRTVRRPAPLPSGF
jgi:hypothetical protein